jgi:hypothetical protein
MGYVSNALLTQIAHLLQQPTVQKILVANAQLPHIVLILLRHLCVTPRLALVLLVSLTQTALLRQQLSARATLVLGVQEIVIAVT